LLAHGRFSINWRVRPEDAVSFVQNFADAEADQDAEAELLMMARAGQVVRTAAESAVTAAVAGIDADSFLRLNVGTDQIREQLQAQLAELDTGITIEAVVAVEIVPPLAAGRAYSDVAAAQGLRDTVIAAEEQARDRQLIAVAGLTFPAFEAAITTYEAADSRSDFDTRAAAAEAINNLFDGRTADVALTPLIELATAADRAEEAADLLAVVEEVGTASAVGSAVTTVNQARNFRNREISRLEGELANYRARLPSVAESPEITYTALHRRMWRDILGGNYSERTFVPGVGEIELLVPRDPGVDKRRDAQRREQELEEQQQQQERQTTRTQDPTAAR
jgi:hypothetical protein